jgi:hypothetical protein
MKKLLVLTLLVGCSFTTGTGAYAYQKYVSPHSYHQGQRQPGEERRWLEERRRQEEERRRQEEERRRKEEESRRQEEERRRQEEERRRQEEERRRKEEESRRQEEEQHRRRPGYPERPPQAPPSSSRDKFRARQVLHGTADRLIQAQRAARNGHYSYGLGMAYSHQKQARNLYYEGRYQRAIEHSMRAKYIADYIIRQNQEGRRHHPGEPEPCQPPHDRLDDQLSIKIVDDKVAIRLNISLD